MSNYDNNMRVSLWVNTDKQKETHPDLKGQGVVDGVEYWVSAWGRKPDANPKAPELTLSFTAKDAKPESVNSAKSNYANPAPSYNTPVNSGQAQAPEQVKLEDFGEDIPF